MKQRALAIVGGLVALTALIIAGRTLKPNPPAGSAARAAELLPYQRSYRELPAAEQQVYFSLRSALSTAERFRAASKKWPPPEALSGEGLEAFAGDRLSWSKLEGGLYVNYLGVPKSGGLRWLVMIIEPDPKELKLPNQPRAQDDVEHHTLADGTTLHVTVWSQPNEGPLPVAVVPYPVADGWTERR
ncbi:MAG: hypothetical protein QM723_25845 [Myxococcaceae bacterium]